MPTRVSAESIALSQEFYSDPQSYGRHDLTRDHRAIFGCIEPRDQQGVEYGRYKTIIQTAGGGTGEGLDTALALTVQRNKLVTIEAGIDRNKDERPLTVFGAHYDCTFVGVMDRAVGEMADPSDFTRDSVIEWARYFGEKDTVAHNLGRVTNAAAVQLEYINDRPNMQHLLDHLDSLYPHHSNVVHVRGDIAARVYTVNLHPHLGKNRNRKPNDPARAEMIQGYHDSLAANVSDLGKAYSLPRRQRGERLTAKLLRAAAARTVITRDILPEMTFLTVEPTNTARGIKIVQQAVV